MSRGAASSFTVASPCARRARIARRVGSARAAKVRLSWSGAGIWLTSRLISVLVNLDGRPAAVKPSRRERPRARGRAFERPAPPVSALGACLVVRAEHDPGPELGQVDALAGVAHEADAEAVDDLPGTVHRAAVQVERGRTAADG